MWNLTNCWKQACILLFGFGRASSYFVEKQTLNFVNIVVIIVCVDYSFLFCLHSRSSLRLSCHHRPNCHALLQAAHRYRCGVSLFSITTRTLRLWLYFFYFLPRLLCTIVAMRGLPVNLLHLEHRMFKHYHIYHPSWLYYYRWNLTRLAFYLFHAALLLSRVVGFPLAPCTFHRDPFIIIWFASDCEKRWERKWFEIFQRNRENPIDSFCLETLTGLNVRVLSRGKKSAQSTRPSGKLDRLGRAWKLSATSALINIPPVWKH